MITIDQLLESVDLDFEPRWVTKNAFDSVSIWGGDKKPTCLQTRWKGDTTEYKGFGELKLSEFYNKDWQYCIYEVPRKTTGKIERFTLEDFVCISDIEDYIRNVLDGRAFNKLNALVDAVNELKGAKNE